MATAEVMAAEVQASPERAAKTVEEPGMYTWNVGKKKNVVSSWLKKKLKRSELVGELSKRKRRSRSRVKLDVRRRQANLHDAT